MTRLGMLLAITLAGACTTADALAARVACEDVIGQACDATKECGGSVQRCVDEMHATCDSATVTITSDERDACVDALQMHGCSGPTPAYDAEAQACIAIWVADATHL